MNVKLALGGIVVLGILMSLGNWKVGNWNLGAVVFGVIAIGWIISEVLKKKKK